MAHARQYAGIVAPLLAERVRNIRGDPRLTPWEENFLASIATALAQHGARCSISDAQAEKLDEIEAKTATAPRDEHDDDEQDDDEP